MALITLPLRRQGRTARYCLISGSVFLFAFLMLVLSRGAGADSGSAAELLWEPVSAATALALPPDDPGTAVILNRDAVARVTPGTRVELFIDGGVATFHIDRAVFAAGVRTLYGSGEKDGASRLVMTVGERSGYATVTTPRGTYSLRVGGDGSGRLYSAAELNRNVDRTQPDYVVVKPGPEAQ